MTTQILQESGQVTGTAGHKYIVMGEREEREERERGEGSKEGRSVLHTS